MPEAKVIQLRRQEPPVPPVPGLDYHCSFASDRPEHILRLAQLAADLGINMSISEGPKM